MLCAYTQSESIWLNMPSWFWSCIYMPIEKIVTFSGTNEKSTYFKDWPVFYRNSDKCIHHDACAQVSYVKKQTQEEKEINGSPPPSKLQVSVSSGETFFLFSISLHLHDFDTDLTDHCGPVRCKVFCSQLSIHYYCFSKCLRFNSVFKRQSNNKHRLL